MKAEMERETSIELGKRTREKRRTENNTNSPRRSSGVKQRDLGIAVP